MLDILPIQMISFFKHKAMIILFSVFKKKRRDEDNNI